MGSTLLIRSLQGGDFCFFRADLSLDIFVGQKQQEVLTVVSFCYKNLVKRLAVEIK